MPLCQRWHTAPEEGDNNNLLVASRFFMLFLCVCIRLPSIHVVGVWCAQCSFKFSFFLFIVSLQLVQKRAEKRHNFAHFVRQRLFLVCRLAFFRCWICSFFTFRVCFFLSFIIFRLINYGKLSVCFCLVIKLEQKETDTVQKKETEKCYKIRNGNALTNDCNQLHGLNAFVCIEWQICETHTHTRNSSVKYIEEEQNKNRV